MKLMDSQKVRYVIASTFNATFGYSIIISLHAVMHPEFNMLPIGILANILGITVSFTTYKLFVFRSKGHWLYEYIRCYIVYGGIAVVNVVGLWILVDILNLSIWLAPLIVIPLCFVISFFSHAKFTFRS